jgi:hypothetical protein
VALVVHVPRPGLEVPLALVVQLFQVEKKDLMHLKGRDYQYFLLVPQYPVDQYYRLHLEVLLVPLYLAWITLVVLVAQ